MRRYFVALMALTIAFVCAKAFAFDDVELFSLSPITSQPPSPGISAILPLTGGVPSYLYTAPSGTSVLVQPGQAPTFIYPGRAGQPSVIITPSGQIYYQYQSRSK